MKLNNNDILFEYSEKGNKLKVIIPVNGVNYEFVQDINF